MKKTSLRKLLVFILTTLVLSQSSLVFAVESNEAALKVGKVETAIAAYEEALDARSPEQISNEEAATEQFQDLMEELSSSTFMSDDVQYPDYYGGSYINDDGNLVVKVLPRIADNAPATISDITNNPNIIIESAEYSLNELLEAKSSIDDFLSLRDNSDILDVTTEDLLLSITAVILSQRDGQIIVQIKDLSTAKEDAFIDYFGELDYVGFEEGEFSSTTSTWKPGGIIFGEAEQKFSIGWPAYYYDAYGDVQRGFVTAGHALTDGETVFGWVNNQNLPIGTCLVSEYTGRGDCDGALVALDTGETINTKTAYNGITLTCTKYVIPTEGNTIYKEGSTTDYTTGKLLSSSSTAVYDNGNIVKDVYYSSNHNEVGDSGGPVYYKSGSAYYAIGQTTGKDIKSYTWTSKMLNTLRPLDCSYIPL